MARGLVSLITAVVVAFSSGGPGAEGGVARAASSSAVHALFDLATPAGGPFPSDWFTVRDPSHITGRRVNLPLPDCAVFQSDCEDLIHVINMLDGFNVQPRLSIPFDGPIDLTTATSQTVFLISLGSMLRGRDNDDCDEDGGDDDGCEPDGRAVGINQVVWDPFTNTLYVKSDELLEQHTRYALIVTRGVLDQSGQPVEATEAFRRFRQHVREDYRRALLDAIHAARRRGVQERDIVTASVFTTQTVTSILEKIRDQIKAAIPEPADFLLGPGGTRTVFARDQVKSIRFNRQILVDGPLDPVAVPIELLDIVPGVVDTIAFGKYSSPDYEVHPGEYISEVGTRSGTPRIEGTNEIYFNLFLPSGPKPPGGWPVAIYCPGANENKNSQVFNIASTMAAHGLATIAINAVGHGFGPLGTLTVQQTDGSLVNLLAGGRGIDQDDDGEIGVQEGMSALPPRTILRVRDGFRQTAADLMQLVRIIEMGMDVDGDGYPEVDASRIYYLGFSQAGMYGTLFLAVEPNVRSGVLTSAGNAQHFFVRVSNTRGGILGTALGERVPSLINPPGIVSLDGLAVGGPFFNENIPLRDGVPLTVVLQDDTTHVIRSPVVNTVDGATRIQEWLENAEWAFQSGSHMAYAPHLRRRPLSGVGPKSVIYNYAYGDQAVPNPLMSALARAGDLADRVTFYRHDLAFVEDPRIGTNPHNYSVRIADMIPLARDLARGAQRQIAIFFATDGREVIHPEPARFFEVPIVPPLPETLNFIIP